jgi:hypothetical protein
MTMLEAMLAITLVMVVVNGRSHQEVTAVNIIHATIVKKWVDVMEDVVQSLEEVLVARAILLKVIHGLVV